MDSTVEWVSSSPVDAIDQLNQLRESLQSELEAAAEEIALRIERDATRNAPVDTGRLRASIDHEVEQVVEHTVRAIVGTNVEYAPFQEVDNPFLRPAIRDNADWIRERVQKALKSAARSI